MVALSVGMRGLNSAHISIIRHPSQLLSSLMESRKILQELKSISLPVSQKQLRFRVGEVNCDVRDRNAITIYLLNV